MVLPPSQAAYLQTKSSQILREAVLSALAPYSLNVTEWRALAAMAQSGEGVRLSEIAKLVSVEAPLVTVIAQKLVRRSFIHFKTDPRDKRAKRYSATDAGRKFLAVVAGEIEDSLRPLFAKVDMADLSAYFRVLEGIIDAKQ